MKVTFNWLAEFVALDSPPQALARLLTMAGLEVESLTSLREPETEREDWLFEIAVTPNRGDCLSLVGIAREVAALTGAALKAPRAKAAKKDPGSSKRIALRIGDARLCARYSARVVDDVAISPSPAWLRYRLEACGIRAINNIVDATNYVMLETGQPLHAFDLDRLAKKKIVVRSAAEIRKFTTLDGVERELEGDDLLICDDDTPVALAGVMGGLDSEVAAATRTILLESANFAPAVIRRTAKRLGLHSEASHRFERGVDPEGTILALDRVASLIHEIAGGSAAAGVDLYPGRAKPKALRLRQERIERLLGVSVELDQAEKLLRAIGLKTERQTKNRSLRVIVSPSRPDLTREADLIEEVARLRGYDSLPTALPPVPIAAKIDFRLVWERQLRALLAGEGLSEAINLPFASENSNRNFPGLWPSDPVAVINPLARENGELRVSLIPGLIENLRLNLAHKAKGFHAFHLGKVFGSDGGEATERAVVAGLLYGARARRGLRAGEEQPMGFLEAKGIVESVLELFRLRESAGWQRSTAKFLHPGRAADAHVKDASLGYLGELHPDLAEELGVPRALVFELDLEKLLEYAPRRIVTQPLPRFPAVERDVAIVVDREFASQQITGWIYALGEPWIERVEVFDQYLGAPIPDGKKSLAYRISYRAEDRTLTDMEVNEVHQRLVNRLGEVFGAEQRI
jgi:phenylalanyl-tRNA synthetase beta chain